jgi:hypothetical protein
LQIDLATQQPSLLPETGALRVSDGQASVAGSGDGERKAGRPKGSQNRFNRDLVKIVMHSLGRHPLEEVARLYNLELAEIGKAFGVMNPGKIAEIKERLLFKLVDKTAPQLAQVKVEDTKKIVVVFGDMGDDTAGLEDDDDTITIEGNEINRLGGASG